MSQAMGLADPRMCEGRSDADNQYAAIFGERALAERNIKSAATAKLERLRDEFAMHAMEVYISKQTSNSFGNYDHERSSRLAYLQADQMLIAREQSK